MGKDLSVNWLQCSPAPDRRSAVLRANYEVQGYLTIKPCGRFLVLNVGRAKEVARNVGCKANVTFTPEVNKPSHSSIRLSHGCDERRLALAYTRLVTKADTYCPTFRN